MGDFNIIFNKWNDDIKADQASLLFPNLIYNSTTAGHHTSQDDPLKLVSIYKNVKVVAHSLQTITF